MKTRNPTTALGMAMAVAAFLLFLQGCADSRHRVIVSVPDQRMVVLTDGKPEASYPVSTSKFGTGDREGSYSTPLGHLCVRRKIGGGVPLGTVFKSRRPTGEVLPPDAPGRDPIVTRILWLDGLDAHNRNAFSRCIYIHGTPQESMIGTPASYGCIRMRSSDVAELYEMVGYGAHVEIIGESLAPLPGAEQAPLLHSKSGVDAASR
jgi:lipoprotein-anchoring transpeptidase ErfK/SrfK